MKTKKCIQKSSLKSWILLLGLFLIGLPNMSFSQQLDCQFDRLLEEMMNEGDFAEQMYLNELHMQEMLNDPVAMGLISNNTVYTIPTVVHVMHLGEAEGTGSNISDAQIIQAIADLNADFAPIDIQYCLAERDPQGSLSTGINRVDASNICAGACFSTGMQINGPLANAVKAASLWPNTDYLNIWVVHSITGAIGYATFPGTSANTDGIVMDDDFFGVAGSNVVAHEAGHFFNLFHTFQGDCPPGVNCNASNCSGTVCPPSDPLQGDMVADTPPHTRSCFSCDFSGSNPCDGGSPNTLFGPNFMNYADIPCLDEFTNGQRDRMRCALMELRSELLNSLGCVPGCTSAMAGFTPSLLGGPLGTTIDFTNTSTGATDYLWEVEGQTFTTTDLTYTFNNQGTYEVCLTASNATCVNRTCELIEISGPDPCYAGYETCNELLNGNLEQNNFGDGVCHFGSGTCDEFGVCNWQRKRATPAFCSESNGVNSFIMADWREAIASVEDLGLQDGQTCVLSFEYYQYGQLNQNNNPVFSFGLIETPNYVGFNVDFTESIRELGSFFSPPNDAQGGYLQCPLPGQAFNYFEVTFTYNAGDPQHLYFTHEATTTGSNSFMQVRDIRINCCGDICAPDPEIHIEQDECIFKFTAINTGDPGDCFWDFGNGDTSTDCDVMYEYAEPGNYTVCLTITCEDLSSVTVCEDVVVPEDCGVECDAVLVQFGYGDDCNDTGDDFDPYDISPCIDDVSDLEPYNGSSGASCQSGVICVQSSVNGWEFTMTAGESIEISQIVASLLYPIDLNAGGPSNPNTCLDYLFPYEVNFYLNGDQTPIHTHNGTLTGSLANIFSDEVIAIPGGVQLGPDDELRVRIDGIPPSQDCVLFELSGLSVNGCCRPCPEDLVDLGPDQTICIGDEVTLNATINTHRTINRRIDDRKDDAEEDTADGDMSIYSSDLELVDDDGEIQVIGVKFNEIDIPQGATITSAFIQFTADEEDDEPTNLTINGEATGNALEYDDVDYNISDRATTAASVSWTPAAWFVGDDGPDQLTPDLIDIVQEIVDQPNWDYGNSMAFVISGTGKRVAESTSGSSSKAPELIIEYELDSTSPYTYEWSTGDVSESITVTPTSTTTYSVTVTDADGCTDTDEVTITLEDCCKGMEVVVNCDGDHVTLSVYINGDMVDPALYQIEWNVANVIYSTSTNPISVNNVDGSPYSVTISQNEAPLCNADGTISCKGDKGGERRLSSVFPNPSFEGDQLYLDIKDVRFLNQEVNYTITSEIGLPMSENRTVTDGKIPLPKLRAGVYLLHLFNSRTGERETVKFYVESM